MNTIKFYYEYEDYGYLSNYYLVDISVDGKIWPSTEHYYQANKSIDPEYIEKVRAAETCDDAKALGNSEECVFRPGWLDVKDDVMMTALRAKFTQHDDLKKLLLDTGDAVLMENSQKDYYWGIGADGSGKSMLGKLLMSLREELRESC